MSLTVTPLAETIGAEITGLDLSRPVGDGDKAALRAAWHRHTVLVLRDQVLTPEQHIGFARILGRTDIDNPNTVFSDKQHPEIFVLTNEMEDGKPSPTRDIGWQWHADLTYTLRPSAGAVLHAQAIPDRGGDTMFANMTRAFETLSEGYQRLLRGLEAIHDFANGAWYAKRNPKTIENFTSRTAPVLQPMAFTHPETGRTSLFIGETAVKQIAGLTVAESAPILDYLIAHATREENIYRHSWRIGDLLVWDNRCAMHKVVADHDEMAEPGTGQVRRMHRVTLQGLPSGRPLRLNTAA